MISMPLRAVLKTEWIGYVNHLTCHGRRPEQWVLPPSRPWVARWTCEAQNHITRTFLRGQIDFSEASRTGERGVCLYFALVPGYYEIHAPIDWLTSRRYFVRVAKDMTITEISREEAIACLQNAASA